MIRARIGAARLVLEEANGGPFHAQISAAQTHALLDVISKAKLSPEETAEVSTTIAGLKFATAAEISSLLEALSPKRSAPAGKRRAQQGFTNLINYFTEDQWTALLDGEVPKTSKLHIILAHATLLGLRLPTEPSIKLMASLWAVVTHSEDELLRLETTVKAVLLAQAKNAFHSLRVKLAEPAEWIDNLPEAPIEMSRKFRAMAAAAFPEGAPTPVQPRINLHALWSFDQSFGCRGGGKRTKVDAVPMLQLQSQPSQQLESIASSWMQRMEMMMMTVMTGAAGGQRFPSSLAAMAQGHPVAARPLRALPQPQQPLPLQMLPPRSSLQLGDDDHAVVQSPSVANDDASAVIPNQSASPAPEVPSAATASPPPKMKLPLPSGASAQTAASSMDDMLGMLDSRSKAKAKSGKAQGGSTKGKSKGGSTKGKSKGKGTDEVKDSTYNKTMSKAKGKAKVHASGKAKAKAKPADGATYGCSKCRWSQKGCAQCRNPDFAGLRWSNSGV